MSDLKALAAELAQVEALLVQTCPPYSVRVANAISALTAAAEREQGLREENEWLTAANESVAVCRKHVADITADGCWVCSTQAAESEVERLKLDRDSWERCALNTEVTVQAERQKVTALREELTNIAKANWREWDVDVRTPESFVEWAVSRAQHALGLSPDAPQPPGTTRETP